MNQFKRAKVIMLPTEDRCFIFLNKDKTWLKSSNVILDDHPVERNQHLYIISDDEIKEGDWYLNADKNVVTNEIVYTLHKATKLKLGFIKRLQEKNSACKFYKVIATTDNSLQFHTDYHGEVTTDESKKCYGHSLPQPSQQFIEKYIESYNKDEVITDVLVEYEFNKYPDIHGVEIDLKVNPEDNTITIKKLKDSWNREEVFAVITTFNNANIEAKNVVKWFEENL